MVINVAISHPFLSKGVGILMCNPAGQSLLSLPIHLHWVLCRTSLPFPLPHPPPPPCSLCRCIPCTKHKCIWSFRQTLAGEPGCPSGASLPIKWRMNARGHQASLPAPEYLARNLLSSKQEPLYVLS